MTRTSFLAVLSCLAAAVAAPLFSQPALAQTPPAKATAASIMADAPVGGLTDWVALRNALASLGDGVGARIEALSSQGAIISFTWSGDQATLDRALQQIGYRLDRAPGPTGRPVLRSAR